MIDADENDRTLNEPWSDEDKETLMALHAKGGFAACCKHFGKSRSAKSIRAKVRAEQRNAAPSAAQHSQLTAIARTSRAEYDATAPRVDTSGRLALLMDAVGRRRLMAKRARGVNA